MKTLNFTIPKATPSGDYIARIEHIGLHAASQKNGAQFYLSCAQVTVTGGGSGTPSPLVAFPGAYSATDPGILIQIYYPVVRYTFTDCNSADANHGCVANQLYHSWPKGLDWIEGNKLGRPEYPNFWGPFGDIDSSSAQVSENTVAWCIRGNRFHEFWVCRFSSVLVQPQHGIVRHA